LLAMVVSLFETGYLRTGAGLFESSPGHLSHEGMATRVADAMRGGPFAWAASTSSGPTGSSSPSFASTKYAPTSACPRSRPTPSRPDRRDHGSRAESAHPGRGWHPTGRTRGPALRLLRGSSRRANVTVWRLRSCSALPRA
jgi:hypothetical protein